MHQQLLNARGKGSQKTRVVFRSTNITRQQRARIRSGQSLVEMSLSMVLLIMLFSGIIDFGRAYFSFVMLYNAVSEGAHWAAVYSKCLPYAIDQTAGDNVNYANCMGSNNITERIINEDETTLIKSDFKSVCWQTLDSLNNHGGLGNLNSNTLTLSVTYRLHFITPFISGMFGTYLDVTASVQEVIRSTGVPPYAPATFYMTDNPGGVTGCS